MPSAREGQLPPGVSPGSCPVSSPELRHLSSPWAKRPLQHMKGRRHINLFAPPQGRTTPHEAPSQAAPPPSLCTPAMRGQIHGPDLQYSVIHHHPQAAKSPLPAPKVSWEKADPGFQHEVTTHISTGRGDIWGFYIRAMGFFSFLSPLHVSDNVQRALFGFIAFFKVSSIPFEWQCPCRLRVLKTQHWSRGNFPCVQVLPVKTPPNGPFCGCCTTRLCLLFTMCRWATSPAP